ncbi:MAG: STAS domain-containing protein [Hydrogenophaga sp.]|uniref:STAS domain-containing protein n=1 Tax=unclassified Hydrogenophaga TaxID=2610897 RepID=UPI00257F1256|nr:STAS domain-containing protein [Hydrogenophaga sp.]MBL0943160.1 STAS domain-containing protein [Hydrogenophaga sp.]
MSEPRLPERLTLDEAAATLGALRAAVAGGEGGAAVTVDAGALRHFDSSAVAVLLELRRELQQQGRTLQVRQWPPRLQDLVRVYGVQELLTA